MPPDQTSNAPSWEPDTTWQDRAPLDQEFFGRPTLVVAQQLLGTLLIHELPEGTRVGRIVETEAYVGPDDRGSHASRGRTPRTRPMFGPPGYAYVYLIYGVHHCFNVVTEAKEYPAAVLLRALEPVHGLVEPARGPGLVCRLMGIDRRHDGIAVTRPPLYVVAADKSVQPGRVASGPRIGIDYAGEWALEPWRFWLPDSPAVSRRRAGAYRPPESRGRRREMPDASVDAEPLGPRADS